jgi:hypothetical protein
LAARRSEQGSQKGRAGAVQLLTDSGVLADILRRHGGAELAAAAVWAVKLVSCCWEVWRCLAAAPVLEAGLLGHQEAKNRPSV